MDDGSSLFSLAISHMERLSNQAMVGNRRRRLATVA